MIITVGGMRQGRAAAQSTERPSELGFGKDEIEFLKPIEVYAEITKMGLDVYIDLTISTAIAMECGRCLGKFARDITARYRMLFVPAQDGSQGRTAEDGVYLYRESTIDLADHICEAVRLAIPMKPLCKPDCRGLCQHCGKNLNEGKCSCEREDDQTCRPFKGLHL